MVKMEIINESEEKISILLKETDRAFVNALRRSLMSDTPKMAIETVRFQMGTFDVCLSCGHRHGAAIAREASGGSGCNNCGKKLDKEGVDYAVWETNGPLPDEMIAQRLAMVPIPTNHEEYHFEASCPTCKDLVPEDRGCMTCNMIYTCTAYGSKEGSTVTAGDMVFLGAQSLEIPEHYRTIPITKLYKGQMLEFIAIAVMGVGSEHAKWSPVCGVTFVPHSVAIINNRSRDRVVPEDIMLLSHEGAATNMYDVIRGKLPRGLNGGVRVVLNNRENTIPYVDPKTKKKVKTKTGNIIVTDFTYLTFKKEGKTIAPESDVKKEVMGWIASNVPKTKLTKDFSYSE